MIEYIKKITHNLPINSKSKSLHPGMFDLIKGWAMISILIDHTIDNFGKDLLTSGSYGTLINFFIIIFNLLSFGCCMMTVFFVISGTGFKKTPPLKCLKKQAKLILIPYLTTAIISIICSIAVRFALTKDITAAINNTVGIAIAFFLGIPQGHTIGGYCIVGMYPTWFLLALFIGWNLLNLVENYIPDKIKFPALLLLAFIGWLIGYSVYYIGAGLIVPLFLYVGFIIKKAKLINKKYPLYLGIPLFILWVMETINLNVDMATGQWPLGYIEVICSTAFAFMLIILFIKLNNFESKFFDAIRYIGRYSLYFICIHNIEAVAIPWTSFVYQSAHETINFIIYIVARFTLCVASLVLFVKFNHLRNKSTN